MLLIGFTLLGLVLGSFPSNFITITETCYFTLIFITIAVVVVNQIVTFVPIIYTVTENERSLLKAAEMKGRVILGDLEKIMEDHKIPMFGCAECKKPIPGCGIF